MNTETRYIIGIGNPQRGDDAAGRMVARQLQCKLDSGFLIEEHDGEAAAIVDWLTGADMVILVDASCSNTGQPGLIRRFDVHDGPLPAHHFNVSSHNLGLAAAIELARAMGILPPTCLVYSIEGKQFELDRQVSPEVHAAIQEVVIMVLQESGCHLKYGENHA